MSGEKTEGPVLPMTLRHLDTVVQTTAALGTDWATQAGTEQNAALLPLLKPTILQASAWDHFLIQLSHIISAEWKTRERISGNSCAQRPRGGRNHKQGSPIVTRVHGGPDPGFGPSTRETPCEPTPPCSTSKLALSERGLGCKIVEFYTAQGITYTGYTPCHSGKDKIYQPIKRQVSEQNTHCSPTILKCAEKVTNVRKRHIRTRTVVISGWETVFCYQTW